MSIPKLTTTIVVLSIFFCFFTKNTHAQEYDLNTTYNSFWPIPNTDKPDYLQKITEPTFNVKLTRIVGDVGTSIPNLGSENWRNVARHGYSVRQPWNADESVIYIGRHRTFNGGWGSGLFLNGETYEPISTSNLQPSGNEHRWHPTDPNLRLILTDNSVKSWNYNTNETITIMSFSGYSNTSMGYTGNWSDDANKIAMFATRNSDGKSVVFALDIQNNIKYPDIDASSMNIDYVSISPLGTYILINANFGNGSDRTKIYDLNGNQVGPYWSEYARPSHFDMAVDQNGDEVAVGVDKSVNEGRVIKRRLSDGQVTVLTTGGWAIHTSARSLQRPGWVYVSTSSSTNWGPYLSEIIAVKLDGTRVERICHARNEFSDYQNEAHPCPSPSGSRVVFATDWGYSDLPIQDYVADFRDLEISTGFGVNAGNDENICEGESVTLTASGAENYTWSNEEITAVITVTPTETTTYIVTGTDSGGNEAIDSVTVTVNPLPTANAGDDIEICQDDSIGLSASGGDSYSWEWDGNQENSQNITISPQVTTTYTVTVTQNGCESTDDIVVTVNPRPVINAGNDVDINIGESTTLTATGEGVFEWNTGETTESITVTPSVTTTYAVTASQNGCTSSDELVVNVIEPETVNANAGEDVVICIEDSTILTANGGANYLWSTGETTQSIIVSPNETTTYTVTVSNDVNSDTDDVIVNVNPLPIADAGDDLSIQHGQSVTLSASGGTEYIWSTGQTTQDIVVNPIEDTTYTVEVMEEGCSDTDSIDVIVSVVATIVDDVTICQGQSTTLYASGGSNYLWNTGATSQSIEVNPTQTTSYSVIVSNGTSSDEAYVNVTVNLLPNANAGENMTIETGQNITLTASGGNSYLWNTGSTSQNISVSPTQTTTYLVEAIINGCSNYDEVTVTVVEPVNANAGEDVEVCVGDEITLTATGGEFFEWATGETSASIHVTPSETTIYSVTVSNGISTQSDDVMVVVDNCTALDDNGEEFIDFDYRVYPNPSNGEVNIKLSGLENISSIYVTDMLGKTIKTETFEHNNGSVINKRYNFSSFSKGIYFITFMQSGSDAITKKLILQ